MHYFSVVILSISLCIAELPVHSQSIGERRSGYKDFVLDGEHIWLLTTTGKLKLGKWRSDSLTSLISTDTSVIAVAKDRLGSIIIGDASHKIKQFRKQNRRWLPVTHYDGKLTGIVFDAKNQCYTITDEGIVIVDKDKRFFPDSKFYVNDQIKNRSRWFDISAYLVDKDDRIWVGFDYGEWGGNVFCFDSQHKSFVELTLDSVRMSLNPVSSFCQGSTSVYMSGGLSHMFMTHGSIIKFNHTSASSLLLSKDRKTPVNVTRTEPDGKEKTEIWTTWKGGHQIGPVAYNPIDQRIYFYSQYGIFKGDPNSDLSTIDRWSNVLKPELQWTGGRANAVGSPMNVLKMEFSPDGILFFLSEHDGLGIVDGKNLRFIQ